MTISWYGEACFLLEAGGIRILIEPPGKESGLSSPRLKSDILIFSSSRNQSGKPFEDYQDDQTFTIGSAGEYEVRGANISGIQDDLNIIYNIEMDGIKIVHLGFLNKELDNEKLSTLGDPDIVLVPAGGLAAGKQMDGGILDAEKAMAVISQIEPKIAIPMLYDTKGLKIKREPLSAFVKESEAKDSLVPKLSIKRKDLIEEETKIVILEKV